MKKALRKSIKHWCLDIRRPLLKGDIILVDRLQMYWLSGASVRVGADECEVCRKVESVCCECPLTTINHKCTEHGSAYREFFGNPCLKTVNKMIGVLKSCLKTL